MLLSDEYWTCQSGNYLRIWAGSRELNANRRALFANEKRGSVMIFQWLTPSMRLRTSPRRRPSLANRMDRRRWLQHQCSEWPTNRDLPCAASRRRNEYACPLPWQCGVQTDVVDYDESPGTPANRASGYQLELGCHRLFFATDSGGNAFPS